jgi:hypothetical protein
MWSKNCFLFKLHLLRSTRAKTIKGAPVRLLSVVPFKLADIGEGIAEVELLKWFVKVRCLRLCFITKLISALDGIRSRIRQTTGGRYRKLF